MGQWSFTVLVECETKHQAERIREEMLREGSGYLSPGEGRVLASPLMGRAEAH